MSYTTEAMADHTLSCELHNKIRDNSTACIQVLPQQFLKPGESYSPDLITTVRHMMATAIDIMTRWIIEGEDGFTKSYNKRIMTMYNLVVALSCFSTNLHCEVDEHKYSALEIILLFTDFGSSRSDFWKRVIRRSCLEVIYPKHQFDTYFNTAFAPAEGWEDEAPGLIPLLDRYVYLIGERRSDLIPSYRNPHPTERGMCEQIYRDNVNKFNTKIDNENTMKDLERKLMDRIEPISDGEAIYHAQLDMPIMNVDILAMDRFDDQIDIPAMSIEDAKRVMKNIENRMEMLHDATRI